MPIPVNCKTALSRSKLREALLISLAALEALYLVASLLWVGLILFAPFLEGEPPA